MNPHLDGGTKRECRPLTFFRMDLSHPQRLALRSKLSIELMKAEISPSIAVESYRLPLRFLQSLRAVFA